MNYPPLNILYVASVQSEIAYPLVQMVSQYNYNNGLQIMHTDNHLKNQT